MSQASARYVIATAVAGLALRITATAQTCPSNNDADYMWSATNFAVYFDVGGVPQGVVNYNNLPRNADYFYDVDECSPHCPCTIGGSQYFHHAVTKVVLHRLNDNPDNDSVLANEQITGIGCLDCFPASILDEPNKFTLAGTLAPGIYQLYRHYHTNPIYDANHQGQTVTSTSNLLTLHVTVPNVIDLGIKGFKLQDEKDSCVDGQIVAKYMVKNFGALDATNVVCSIYMADHASDLSGNPSTNPNITPIGVLNLGTIVGGDLTHDVVHSFDVPNAVGKKWFSVYVTDHCAG